MPGVRTEAFAQDGPPRADIWKLDVDPIRHPAILRCRHEHPLPHMWSRDDTTKYQCRRGALGLARFPHDEHRGLTERQAINLCHRLVLSHPPVVAGEGSVG